MMIADSLNNYRIILASRSPRRQKLLRQLGLEFRVVIKDFSESYPEDLRGDEVAMHIAHEKALSFKGGLSPDEIVITADTIVWCNNKILAKPQNREEAVTFLKEISGNTHEVITGVSIYSSFKEIIFSVSTMVTFETLSGEEINFYIEKYKPYDKAGAYGIQEWIGLVACSRIDGSYSNVVGLPVHRLYKELLIFVNDKDKRQNKKIKV